MSWCCDAYKPRAHIFFQVSATATHTKTQIVQCLGNQIILFFAPLTFIQRIYTFGSYYYAYLSNVLGCITVYNALHMTTRWKSMGCVKMILQIFHSPFFYLIPVVLCVLSFVHFHIFHDTHSSLSTQRWPQCKSIDMRSFDFMSTSCNTTSQPMRTESAVRIFQPHHPVCVDETFRNYISWAFVKIQRHHNDVKQYC